MSTSPASSDGLPEIGAHGDDRVSQTLHRFESTWAIMTNCSFITGGRREPAHDDAVGGTRGQVGDVVHGAHQARQVGPVHGEDRPQRKPVEDRLLGVVRLALELVQLAGRLLELVVAVGGEALDHVLQLLDDDDDLVDELGELLEHLLLAFLAHGVDRALEGRFAPESAA